MVDLCDLVAYTDQLLDAAAFQDYCPNGLQVEGRSQVGTLVAGVTASQQLVDQAARANADVLLVHHGYFWRGENPCITGMKRRRIQALLEAGMSLLAYHLPLDAHPLYGNNAELARVLSLPVHGRFGPEKGPELAMYGDVAAPLAGDELARHIEQKLGRAPVHVAGTGRSITRLGWCTGAAQGMIEQAAELGLDAYISGEISEPTAHVARELGLHYFAAGHHATERYGAAALGRHLAEQFHLKYQFIDIDNPA